MRLIALCLLLSLISCKSEVDNKTSGLKLLAFTSLPSTLTLDEAPFGGLSGMIPLGSDEYLAVSDDRSEYAPARMVKLKITFDGKELKVQPLSNINLTSNGSLFKLNEIDPESITNFGKDVVITSEGSYRANQRFAPFIKVFDVKGVYKSDIAFDHERYIPEEEGAMTKGVRSNLGFESASLSPSGKTLFVANEAALRQDAPSDYSSQNIIRLMAIDPKGQTATREYAIKLENITTNMGGAVLTGENGVSDIMSISDDEVLIMERAWISAARKQVVKLYLVKIDAKAEVSGIDKLEAHTKTLEKELIYDFADSGHKPDNLEILCLGPKVNDKDTLIVASDNNFSTSQTNQFYLFEILPR